MYLIQLKSKSLRFTSMWIYCPLWLLRFLIKNHIKISDSYTNSLIDSAGKGTTQVIYPRTRKNYMCNSILLVFKFVKKETTNE